MLFIDYDVIIDVERCFLPAIQTCRKHYHGEPSTEMDDILPVALANVYETRIRRTHTRTHTHMPVSVRS